MRILGLPAWSNAAKNPYNALLSAGLVKLGCEVEELAVPRALWRRADIVHLHWPQAVLNEPPLRALRRASILLLMLAIQRLRGAQIVWTVHNVTSHERRLPRAERWLMVIVLQLVTALIVLNGHCRAQLIAEYPRAERLRWSLVPHGLYDHAYPQLPGRAEARARFGLDDRSLVVGLIGCLKAYKRVERLIDATTALPPGELTALIAGHFADCDYADFVREGVDAARGEGHAIVLRDGHLSDADMVAALGAIDLLVLPYDTESNSGLAILAAECGVPMLLADTGPMRELVAEIGVPTTRTSRSFSPGEILTAARDARAAGWTPPSSAFLANRAQSATAALTHDLFLRLARTQIAVGLPPQLPASDAAQDGYRPMPTDAAA